MARIKVRIQPFLDRAALQLQWTDPVTGKRKTQSARTADPDEAEQARADLEYELNHGLHAEPGRLTWPAFRQLFEREYIMALRDNTCRSYGWTFDAFEASDPPRLLAGITQRTLSAWVATLRQTLAPSSIALHLEHLRAALRWAADQELLTKVPRFPKVEVPKRTPRPVPEELFERLLAAAGDDTVTRAYLLSGWLAGLRRSEAAHLEWEPSERRPWLDFEAGRIWLPATYVKGKRDQWIPVDPRLAEAFQALPRSGSTVFAKAPQTWTNLLQRLAKMAGVRLSMRALRRGFVCRYASKVPAQVLKQLARHSSLETTLGFYANVDDAVEAAVRNNACNTHAPKPQHSSQS